MSPASEPGRRLFFALWPDDLVRARLARVARAIDQGRKMDAGNLHVTLHFLGNTPAETQACVERAAAGVRGRPFELVLSEVGHWPRPQVVWLGPRETPSAMLDLHTALVEAMRPCGFEPEGRAFHPHVTLARKVRRLRYARSVAPIAWRVADFCLVESRTTPAGARYQVLRRWALDGDG